MTEPVSTGVHLGEEFEALDLSIQLQVGQYGLVDAGDRLWVGRTWAGLPCVLFECEASGAVLNVEVGQIGFRGFVAARRVSASEERALEGALLICRSGDSNSLWLFWRLCALVSDSLVRPFTSADVRSVVWALLDLFKTVGAPPSAPAVGLLGELVFILSCSSVGEAVEAWHSTNTDAWDFEFPFARIDVKATELAVREHSLSYAQANALPLLSISSFFCSIQLRRVANGLGVSELVDRVLEQLGGDRELERKVLRLASDISLSDGPHIDLAEAVASARLVDVLAVPAIRGPVPPGVDLLRFRSNFDLVNDDVLMERLRWREYSL